MEENSTKTPVNSKDAPLPPKQEGSLRSSPKILTVVIISAVFGLAGGLLGVFLLDPTFDQGISDNRQEIVLQESEVIAEIADAVGPSVVSINVETTETGFFSEVTGQSAGSGIILTDDGLVVTNKHVIEGRGASISIVTADGEEYENVEVIDKDPTTDIAYLQIKGANGLAPAKLGDSSDVRVGEKVVAIGNALGRYDNTVTSGIISGVGRPVIAGGGGTPTESLDNLFQTDAAINPGNSGGPLVNINGEIIGINTAVAGNAENIGFAIPIDDVKTSIDSVKETGEIVKPYLGVHYLNITPNVAERFDLPVKQGAYIFSGQGSPIVSDSPAAAAGLTMGDIITNVNGEDVTDRNLLSTLINRHEVGQEVTITIIRSDEEQEIGVTLDRLPDSVD